MGRDRQGLAASRRMGEDHPRRHEGSPEAVPLVQGVHGQLRALRRVRRQVPLLPRHRRPEEHAGAARRACPFGLSQRLHGPGENPEGFFRFEDAHAGGDQGVAHVLPSVHRVPPLFGLLPDGHRHRRDHHDGARAAQPHRRQQQLDSRPGGQLQPHGQPPRHRAAHLRAEYHVDGG